MPNGDNKCDRCGQWSGPGHVCPEANAEAAGGTDALDERLDERLDVAMDGDDRVIYRNSGLYDSGVRVSERNGVTTVEVDVHVDFADHLVAAGATYADGARTWLDDNEPEIERWLSDTYGVEFDEDAGWDPAVLTRTSSWQGPLTDQEAVGVVDDDPDLKRLHRDRSLVGGSFAADLVNGVSDRQLFDHNGDLTVRATQARAYNDSPLFEPHPDRSWDVPTITPPEALRGAEGADVAFADIPPRSKVAYNDAYANTFDALHRTYARLGDDWESAALPDNSSKRVRRLMAESSSPIARMHGRHRARAAFAFSKLSADTARDAERPDVDVQVMSGGRKAVVSTWRTDLQGGGYIGQTSDGDQVRFTVHDVVGFTDFHGRRREG